ncbi:MAG TPA: hypothetical protein VF590_22245, partial [Isosphaeraceae bacterium]
MTHLGRMGERWRNRATRPPTSRRRRTAFLPGDGFRLEERCLLAPVWASQGPTIIRNGQVEG